ncbi:MAG: hypothetical protein EBV23_09000 [Flavobacteriia bacterium]|nr:hypothetical protein [Flavobacteriia bacterium]
MFTWLIELVIALLKFFITESVREQGKPTKAEDAAPLPPYLRSRFVDRMRQYNREQKSGFSGPSDNDN